MGWRFGRWVLRGSLIRELTVGRSGRSICREGSLKVGGQLPVWVFTVRRVVRRDEMGGEWGARGSFAGLRGSLAITKRRVDDDGCRDASGEGGCLGVSGPRWDELGTSFERGFSIVLDW